MSITVTMGEDWRLNEYHTMQELRDRIAELEYYNLGLANESCAQQEKIRELEAELADAWDEAERWEKVANPIAELEAENQRLKAVAELAAKYVDPNTLMVDILDIEVQLHKAL